ncbi:UNVERIFIED_CONTAM: hypothetical protein Slati_4465100 [Sesamum latifolium]|uniref:Uncharacterized protein n=1 Tax=Sesamum latifolium TaxID=2727402 RepID=A0AAW2SRB8_9LAMI
MCMTSEYIFLAIVIPDPSSPKHLVDVYLEPLIEELQNLWHVGVLTHDNAMNQTFMMRPALMWTVKAYPLMGWRLDGAPLVLWGLFVPQEQESIHYQSSGRKVERPRLTGEQIRVWVVDFSPPVEVPLTLPPG